MHVWQATAAIFCCHILTGTASVVTRFLVEILPPEEIAFLRYLIGGLFLLPLFFIHICDRPDRRLLLKISGLGVLFFALFPFLFSWSFVHTTAARGSIVLATMPIWAMVISKFTGRERVTPLSFAAVILTFVGLAIALSDKLFISSEAGPSFKGEFIMLLAALTGAVYTAFSKTTLRQTSAAVMTPIAMLAGSLFLFPFAVSGGIYDTLITLSKLQFSLVIYLGAITGGLAFFLFNWSLSRSTPTFNALFVVLNPITAIFLGNLFLGEELHGNFIVGIAVIFAGLALAVKAQVDEHRSAVNMSAA